MFKTVCSDNHRLHFPKGELFGGELVRPFECPERWEYIKSALIASNHTEFLDPVEVSQELLLQIHDARFLEFLQSAWQEWLDAGYKGDALPTVFPARRMQQREPKFIDGKLGYYSMAIETALTEGTWQAALSSAGCAIKAQQLVSAGEREVFSLCRPPGHHAASDLYGGYCFLNNAALAAQAFLNDGAERVAILDVDFHHGNGTQDIFYKRNDVMFLSLHGDPQDAFPHFLGYEDEKGEGAGEGFNFNYPMPPETRFTEWHKALGAACNEIKKFSPDTVVVSLGVDTYEKDPISFFKLGSDDFITCGKQIAELDLPTLFVMEGGYAVEEIGTNTVNVLNGFSGVNV